MQFTEGLSDRQAADAVRRRIDWEYTLGLELTDSGCDDSILNEFRMRLLTGGVAQLLLETMLKRLQERGLLKARGKQRTDSTHILAAIRAFNRLAWVGETMRFVLNRLAAIAPVWVQAHLRPEWPERYGARVENDRLPKTEGGRRLPSAPMGSPFSRPCMRLRRPRRCGPNLRGWNPWHSLAGQLGTQDDRHGR
jgi:transposase